MSIHEAQDEYHKASKRLMEEVAKDYPLGSILVVQIGGRQTIQAEVVAYSDKADKPMLIYGENLNGRARRQFYPKNVIAVLSKPGSE